MDSKTRLIIVYGVVVFCFLFQWITLWFIATEQTRRWCLKLFGVNYRIPTFCRMFRSMGWIFTNASAGLLATSYVLDHSNIRHFCEQTSQFKYITASLSFFIFLVMYGLSAKVHYVFLSTAEDQGQKRWLCGFFGWLIGLVMLSNSSWFVVGK